MESYLGRGTPSNGSIYVCNLPQGTDENMLAEFFGTIGLLKVWRLTRYHFESTHHFFPFFFATTWYGKHLVMKSK